MFSFSETPLMVAAMLDKPRDMIITLVSGGYHIDYRNKHGYTGIHRAAQKNNYEAVKVHMFVILAFNFET